MKQRLTAFALALLIATSPIVATAQPGNSPPPAEHGVRPPPLPDARWDRGREPPPYWNDRQWSYRQNYLRRHHHRDDDNNATVGLVTGVILGFVLGAAITDSQERQARAQSRLSDETWLDDCARRYRSFDRQSGTYLGYDGLRHYCPVSR